MASALIIEPTPISRYVKKDELFPKGSLFDCSYCGNVYKDNIDLAIHIKNGHENLEMKNRSVAEYMEKISK